MVLPSRPNPGRRSFSADQIREYVLTNYIDAARQSNQCPIDFRVGEIRDRLGRRAQLSAIAAALGADKFEVLANALRLQVWGPFNGANTTLAYCWCRKHRSVIKRFD